MNALWLVGGTSMGAPVQVPLAQNVPPGTTADVSIEMVAPNKPGVYRSEWMFLKADGPLFGVGRDARTPLSAQIVVKAGDTPASWQTYTSTEGLFSIQYPATYDFYENQLPSVDGVTAPLSNTAAIRIGAQDSIILSITYKPIDPGTSPAAFAAQDDACVAKSNGEPLQLSGQDALLFKDTSCGPYGSSVIYITRGAHGYRIEITTISLYDAINGSIAPILDTFQLLDQSSAVPAAFCTKPVTLDVKAGKVSYNGITFRADPALAKSVTAQDCLAVPF